MYAVIFTATVGDQDSRYRKMAGQLRDLAMADFGCTDFISVTEGEQEIAISYWPDEASIKNWKQQAASTGLPSSRARKAGTNTTRWK